MTHENLEVRSFFAGYEAANAAFDLQQIAACYANVFLFGGPDGVQSVKKEDFLKVLPRRKEFFRSQGLLSSTIDSLEASALAPNYTLVKVNWNMRFDTGTDSRNAASYVLLKKDDGFQIVFQVDHQDLRKTVPGPA